MNSNRIWHSIKVDSLRCHSRESGNPELPGPGIRFAQIDHELQREHLELMIDLSKTDYRGAAAYKPIATLVVEELRELKKDKIDRILGTHDENLDPYTRAHLKDASTQIERALDAHYIYRQL